MKEEREHRFLILSFFWIFVVLVQIFIWCPKIRQLFFGVNPALEMVSSVLNDLIWIPIAFILPVYIGFLVARVIQNIFWRDTLFFLLFLIMLLGLMNIPIYFKGQIVLILWYLIVLIIHIIINQEIDLHRLVFTLVLFIVFINYNNQLWPRLGTKSEKNQLSVMSFNFNTKNLAYDDERTIQFIQTKVPDIIFLQEFTKNELKRIQTRLGDLYPYQNVSDDNDLYRGVIILSRKEFHFSENIRVYQDSSKKYFPVNHAIIKIGEKNIHLFNCHLTHGGRLFIRYLAADSEKFSWLSVKNTYTLHLDEAYKVIDLIKRYDEPIILAGDFNDTSNSLVYKKLNSILNSTFEKAGWGLGTTYGEWTLAQHLPTFTQFFSFDFLRIDHIFCSRDFKVQKANVLPLQAFDHRPQIAVLNLR